MAPIPAPQTPLGTPLYDTLRALQDMTNATARDALYLSLSHQVYYASPHLQAAEPVLYAAARTAMFRHAGEVIEALLHKPTG